ncbi:MAG: hypothetical protein JST92_11945 [Deltaproteobacteria bacterium]|nr:hypothetical protein [Deltaproteobacteria bacterium]
MKPLPVSQRLSPRPLSPLALLLVPLLACGSNTGEQSGAPVINSFTASPTTISLGNSATLSWDVSNATALSINNGPGIVTGKTSVSVTPTQTTQYTLSATGPGGSSSAKVTVIVTAAQPKAVINLFTANPPSISAGNSSTLSWNVTNATALSIDNGVGTITGTTGTINVTPSATTTYTLSATGLGGNDSATATVTVNAVAGLRLEYQDPANTSAKKVILTKNTTLSTASKLYVDVKIGASAQSAFGLAMNLPLDHTKATVATTGAITLPAGVPPLNPGSGTGATLGWAVGTSGPLTDIFTMGLARKKSSASDSDVNLPASATLCTIEFDVVAAPDPANGDLFNGASLPATAKLSLLKRDGSEAASQADFAVGRLYITH